MKVATFVAFGAVLALGLAGQARAADVAQVSCDTNNNVLGKTASSGVTFPTSCAVGSGCAQCFADLLANKFVLTFDYANTPNSASGNTATIQSQAIFLRGGL
jgi:hypothetical protein